MFWQRKKPKRKTHKVAPPKPVEAPPKPPKQEEPKQKKVEKKKPEEKNLKIDPKKEFLRVFNQLTNRHRSWDVWRDFIVMYACALSNPVDKEHYDEREALYLRTIKKYNKQEQPLFPELAAHTVMALEENPEQDFLGSIYMSLNLGNQHNGQFFIPYHVCELMAEVTMQDSVMRIEEDGYITINDKTTPRLIQFHILKNAVNPPFLGGFLFSPLWRHRQNGILARTDYTFWRYSVTIEKLSLQSRAIVKMYKNVRVRLKGLTLD